MPFQKVRVYRGQYGLWFVRCPCCDGFVRAYSEWRPAVFHANEHVDIWHSVLETRTKAELSDL